MRLIFLVVALAGAAWSQTLGEVGAAVAGGTAGGAAGKKVSDGITTILGKVDQQTTAAAASAAPKPVTPVPPAKPLFEAGHGVPSGSPSIDGLQKSSVAKA